MSPTKFPQGQLERPNAWRKGVGQGGSAVDRASHEQESHRIIVRTVCKVLLLLLDADEVMGPGSAVGGGRARAGAKSKGALGIPASLSRTCYSI